MATASNDTPAHIMARPATKVRPPRPAPACIEVRRLRRELAFAAPLAIALFLTLAVSLAPPMAIAADPAQAAETFKQQPTPLPAALAAHVRTLSQDIGPRHTATPKAYSRAARYIADVLEKTGISVHAIPMPPAAHCPPILVARFGPGDAPAPASPPHPDAAPDAAPDAGAKPDTAPSPTPGASSTSAPHAPHAAAPSPTPDAHHGPALLLCAHYDSVPGSPGAGDNASGVAVLLEVARALERRPPPAAVDVAFLPNEEEPHFMAPTCGSVHYAALLAHRHALPALAVAVDTVGWPAFGPRAAVRIPRPLRIADTDLVVGSRSPARAQASALARSLGCVSMTTDMGALWLDRSDHAAFAAHGVPAALVAAWAGLFSPFIHSPRDTPQHLDFTLLENVVIGLMDFTRRLGPGASRPPDGAPACEPSPPPAARQGDRP